ncbi:hypothetical protein L873DRAFT_1795171 [Choiromyces venosus 120613-1]|uniref:Uncharacterized protein n=1 Tax=Choiromyces venosus 120613-1 TaxID=1336337 RepID=A0A3N4IY69_9PEZI|nr:hypothetical protein L873DRAFT_1795171 [Choiromyces venosus 120613-1]
MAGAVHRCHQDTTTNTWENFVGASVLPGAGTSKIPSLGWCGNTAKTDPLQPQLKTKGGRKVPDLTCKGNSNVPAPGPIIRAPTAPHAPSPIVRDAYCIILIGDDGCDESLAQDTATNIWSVARNFVDAGVYSVEVYSVEVASGNRDSTDTDTDTTNLNKTFLRALQPTDPDGVAQSLTLFPRHCQNRATHSRAPRRQRNARRPALLRLGTARSGGVGRTFGYQYAEGAPE